MSIVNLLLYTSLALSLLAVVAGIAALVGLAVLVWRVNRPRKVQKAVEMPKESSQALLRAQKWINLGGGKWCHAAGGPRVSEGQALEYAIMGKLPELERRKTSSIRESFTFHTTEPPSPKQLTPLAFEGNGWLALMREGKPIAMKPARPLVGDPQQATCDSVEELAWAWRDYWKPIDEKTAAMYRLTVPVIE